MQIAGQHAQRIVYHPARNHGVKHHEQIVSDDAEPTESMPMRVFRLQIMKRQRFTVTAGAANCVLANQNRPAQNRQTNQIQYNKCGTAVLSADIREFPYISQSHGTAGRNQNKSQSCAEIFSFFHLVFILSWYFYSITQVAKHWNTLKQKRTWKKLELTETSSNSL